MSENKKFLYRIENPDIPVDESRFGAGGVSHLDLVGQWFATDPKQIRPLIIKKASRQPGAQLVVAEVPAEDLEDYHVSKSDLARDMDIEPDNYLIPRDGSVPTVELPLDELVDDLYGKNDFKSLLEIRLRISQRLGELSLIGNTES